MSVVSNEKVFDDIYRYRKWGVGSGTGSIKYFNEPFIEFVNDFLDTHEIRTVVDIGCGDWQIAQHLSLGDREYIGCDVSSLILNKTRAKFAGHKRTFLHLDATTDVLPHGDLAIVKDVLLHLSNENIQKVLTKLDSFTYVIIQNDWGEHCENKDIMTGSFRSIDILKKPFLASQFQLIKKYEEGVRQPLNVLRHFVGLSPVEKAIYVRA